MTKINVISFSVEGRLSESTAEIPTHFPLFALDDDQKMAYALSEHPSFYDNSKNPIELHSVGELYTVAPPVPPAVVHDFSMMVEQNAVWPITWDPVPDVQLRSIERQSHHQEGIQYAKAYVTRSSNAHPMATMGLAVAAIVFLLAAVAIVLIVLSQRNIFLGTTDQPSAGLLALGLALGLTSLRDRIPGLRVKPELRESTPRDRQADPQLDDEDLVEEEGPPENGLRADLEPVILQDEWFKTAFYCTVPFSELYVTFPQTARYVAEIGSARWISGGICAAIGFGLVFGLLSIPLLPFNTIGAAIWGLLAGMPVLGFLGWWKFYPFLVGESTWALRRLLVRDEDGAVVMADPQRGIPQTQIVAIESTNLRGVPLDYWNQYIMGPLLNAMNQVNQEEIARLSSGQASQLSNGANGNGHGAGGSPEHSQEMAGAGSASGSNGNGRYPAGDSRQQQKPTLTYKPVLDRATTLYEQLHSRDARDEFRSELSTAQKIQALSMAGIALGAVGLLVFLFLITAK